MSRDNAWGCKVGFADFSKLPDGADAPMRKAVAEAFQKLTGEWPEFMFSGWSETLTDVEREVIARKAPR